MLVAGVLFLLLMLAGRPSQAADYTVYMTVAWTFSPGDLEIQEGDTVTWVNGDQYDAHDTVSDDGYWDSGSLDYLQTFQLAFPVAGTFPYQDSFYGPIGMTGTIVVDPATTTVAPVLISPVRLSNSNFQFTVTNLVAGTTNVLLASTNLANWTAVYTNIAASTGFTYVDTGAAAFGRRFYRAMVLP